MGSSGASRNSICKGPEASASGVPIASEQRIGLPGKIQDTQLNMNVILQDMTFKDKQVSF